MAGTGKNIIKIFTGTFVSRIFGFIREIVVGAYFGTGRVADAFTFALLFPNLFRQILGEDMVERAFMPPFKTIYDKGNKKKAWKYISVTFNWFFFILLGIMTLLYLITPLIFNLIEYFDIKTNFDYSLSLKLIFILLPFMLFIGIAAFAGSMLNFFERNWIFGFAPVMLSVGVIGGIVFLEPVIGNYSIAAGYVLGAFLQMVIQIPFITSKKFRKETDLVYHKKLKDPDNDFKSIKRESRIISLNAVFNKSTEFFGRLLATTLVSGATSSLFYANRIFQLPFAIISLPIARGINPALNRMKATGDLSGFSRTFRKGIDYYLLLFIPVTVIFITSSEQIISIILKRGEFDTESVILTSSALQMYCLGLIPMSFVGYYVRILSLVEKNFHALKISMICAGFNIIAAYLLSVYTPLSHAGIALASSLAFLLNMILLHRAVLLELSGLIEKAGNYFFSLSNLISILLGIVLIFLLGGRLFDNISMFNGKLNDIFVLFVRSVPVILIYLCKFKCFK